MLLAVLCAAVLAWTTTNAALICPTLRVVNITVTTDFKEDAIVENLPDLLAYNNGAHLFISPYKIANNDMCVGLLLLLKNNVEVSFSIVDTKTLYIFLHDPYSVQHQLTKQVTTSGVVLKFSCKNDKTYCLQLQSLKKEAVTHRLEQRSLTSHAQQGHASSSTHYNMWILPPLIGLIVGVVLLTLALSLCVKGSSEYQPTSQPQMSGGLRILAGPPPEYNSSPPTTINEVTPNLMTIQTEHSSPSTPSVALEGGPSSSTDSLDDHRRSKKVDAPLPQIPQLVVAESNPLNDDQGEDKTDESPYDYAKFDGEGQHEGRAEDVQNVDKNRKTPGSYAKVSRHSESNQDITNYAEVRQFNSFESRVRSATDPVEPSLPSSPFHSRTFTGIEGATHLPLPLPPRDYEQEEGKYDDTYDSIEDLRAAADAKLKTKNSLDDQDDEDMYESVPEEFKEELGILAPSAPLLPLRNLELASNTSSPTKVSNLASPDSPTAKLFKKSTKESKRKNRTESASSEDEHKHRMFLFNRFRSASASTMGVRKDNKKDHEMLSTSPDHNLPLPPIPHPHYFPPMNEEDDENGTYDSVQDKVTKTLSLPPAVRMSAFSSRVNEPLPEVPEDLGSGGTTFVVKRDHLIETTDPNYDTVNSAMLGSPVAVPDDIELDPDYDTVKRKPQNSPPLPHSGHGYATVSSLDLPIENPVKHDDMGYALLDEEIVQRKRAESLTKSSVDNPGDPPHDQVKQEELDSKSSDDPGYASIKQVLGTLSESENVPSPEGSVQNDQEPKPSHGYAKVTSHSSTEDDKDPYATIDPEIIQRKRAESHSKSSSSQSQEPPYNEVKDLKPTRELLPNEPVDISRELCHQTEPLTVSEPESDEVSLQPQGDDNIIGQVEIKIDNLSDDEDKYSRIDLVKKHQNKKKVKETTEDPLDVCENVPPPSPVPSLPPIGDLGDISEFEPPPVPTQRLDVHDDNTSELSHNEDELADAEPPYSEVMLTSKTQDRPRTNGECKIIKVIPHNRGKTISSQEQMPTQELTQNSIPLVSRSLHSSTSSEGVPVYDSLESQQPMYDSLDPVEGGPLYDSLEAVPAKEDNLNHVDNLNVNV